MRFKLRIIDGTTTLVEIDVEPAFDATSIEVANRMKFAVQEALPGETAHPRHDQFLIGTAAHDWIRSVYKGRRIGVATIPLSDGRPCTTVPFPPEHVRLHEGECHVVMSFEDGVHSTDLARRRMSTTALVLKTVDAPAEAA
jgi:hypothetical protein